MIRRKIKYLSILITLYTCATAVAEETKKNLPSVLQDRRTNGHDNIAAYWHAKERQRFHIYKAMYIWALEPVIHTAFWGHSRMQISGHTHTQNYNLNWMCFQFCQSQRIVLLLLDSMACLHSRKRLLNNLGQDWFSIIWQPSFQPDWKNVMLKSFTQVSPLD